MQFHMLIKGLYHFLTLIYILYIQEVQRYLKPFYHIVIQRFPHFSTIYMHTRFKFSIFSLGCLKCKLDPRVLYDMIEPKFFCFFMVFLFFIFRKCSEVIE